MYAPWFRNVSESWAFFPPHHPKLWSRCDIPMLNSKLVDIPLPIGSMYGIYANIGGILMVNVTIYSIHGSYGLERMCDMCTLIRPRDVQLISVGLSSAWFPGRSQHILTIFAICFFNAGTPWNPGNSMGVFGLIHPFLHQTWPWFVGLMRYTWLSTSRSPKKKTLAHGPWFFVPLETIEWVSKNHHGPQWAIGNNRGFTLW